MAMTQKDVIQRFMAALDKKIYQALKHYKGLLRDNFKQCAITGSASYPGSTIFTKGGLTVIVPAKSSLTADQQVVVQGLYSC